MVALSTLDLDPGKEVMVRVHSECLTGDIFHAHTCDCGPQKDLALKMIYEHGNGIFIYHRQEGRNMGLFKKVQSYNLMQGGMDTHEAGLALVDHPDAREYSDVLTVLDKILASHKSKLRLLTNNPYKILYLERHGYHVAAEPLRVGATIQNAAYTAAKTQKFLHNSIGYGPYTGVTLFREDIARQGKEIAGVLDSFATLHSSRKIFLGIAARSKHGDLKDAAFIHELNSFHGKVSDTTGVSIVLHLDYPTQRQGHRELLRFLGKLTFAYSLQFRLPPDAPRTTKIDLDILDSFHAEHLIFQMKEKHFHLIEQRGFIEYFSSPNKFILIDQSWGNGKEEDIAVSKEKILKFVSHGLSRVAVAGGYNEKNVTKIYELEDYFKIPISVDAESKLRTKDALDLHKVKEYLHHFFPAAKSIK
jgi:GTP cyclohydrolase II